jgi:RNA polymerase sigma factor (sigma-70 family)
MDGAGGDQGGKRGTSPEDPEGILQTMYPALVRTARMLSPAGDELDLVHDTLVEVLIRYPDFRGLAHPKSYAMVVLARLAYSKRAKRLPEASISIDATDLLESQSSQVEIARVSDWLTIQPVLMSLARRQRTCVYLRFIVGMDDSTISELLGCSRVTVRSQIARGLRKMRAVLGEKMPAEGEEQDG